MENQGHPRPQKLKKALVYLAKDVDGLARELFKNFSLFNITDDADSCDFSINCDAQVFHISSALPQFKALDLSLPICTKTIRPFLSFLQTQLQAQSFSLEKSDIATARKSKRQYHSNLSKLVSSMTKQTKPGTVISKAVQALEEENWIIEAFDESNSLDSILDKVLNVYGFQSYEVCQLIHHEKGKPEADSYFLSRNDDLIKNPIPTSSFNQLFQLIKKSKNKNFNQSQLLQEQLDFTGSFLAKEIELKEHNVLFFISRNAFLPNTSDELSYFTNFIPVLKNILEILLIKTKLTDREKNLILSLNFYPRPIGLRVGENFIFKNKAFNQDFFESKGIQNEDGRVFNLGYDRYLCIWDGNSEETITDINHHQRISLLGELLNTLKHELSNPLFGLKITAELFAQEVSEQEFKETLEEIALNSGRCQEILNNLSNLYLDTDSLVETNLDFVIKETLTLTKSETRGIERDYINKLQPDDLIIKTHPTWLTQIVFNLLINSSQAIKNHNRSGDGKITVELKREGQQLIILVKDNGPGIPLDQRAAIFRPYFTTKTKGTGLGLAICKRLADKLGATLNFHHNDPFPGVTFSLSLTP